MAIDEKIKVSIILTTFNCENNLVKTLESIESQDYTNIEIIIKDGQSKDRTVEIIEDYQNKSKYSVLWKSEKDLGIYDAMNQGYEMCSGDIILFFNDVFLNSTVVSKMVSLIGKSSGVRDNYIGAHADLIYTAEQRVIRKWKMGEGTIEQGWMPGHPTLFLKREVYEKYGLYDTAFRIAADYDFMIRILKDKDNKLIYYPDVIISMFYGGTSSGGLKNYFLSFKEGYRALKKNGVPLSIIVNIRRMIRVILQFRR